MGARVEGLHSDIFTGVRNSCSESEIHENLVIAFGENVRFEACKGKKKNFEKLTGLRVKGELQADQEQSAVRRINEEINVSLSFKHHVRFARRHCIQLLPRLGKETFVREMRIG